jgi:hypothetical protein
MSLYAQRLSSDTAVSVLSAIILLSSNQAVLPATRDQDLLNKIHVPHIGYPHLHEVVQATKQ